MNLNVRRDGIYFFIAGFGVGVVLRSFYNFGLSFSVFFLTLALALALLYRFRKGHVFLLGGVVLLSVSLGILRFDVADLDKGDPILDARVGEHITVVGVIIDEPDERETNTKLTVRFESVDEALIVSEKALITVDVRPRFNYGDKIKIKGELKKPENFQSDDGRDFDYVSFLAKDDIFYQIFFPEIVFLEEKQANPIKQVLFDVKHAFLEQVETVIPDPQAALLGGLVVGAKQSLGEKLTDDFRKTGIIHIVVLSGYNVTIVAEFIMRALSFMPMAFTWSFGIATIALFALMTGASATIVRASIMAILVIIARATGRTYAITRALFFAGFVMVLHNPNILVFDSSFQLSFMATLGLIYLAPKLEEYFGLVPSKWQLREFATATVATQLFVLPMLLYKMGELSLVALPVNLLILVFVPITMLFGFLTGVVGFASVILSLPFAWITNALLTYQLTVVDLFARLPFASVEINSFPLWAAVLMYVFYGVLLFLWKRKNIS